MPFPLGRSVPWRRPASRISARCWIPSTHVAPLRKCVTIEEVGNVAAFLCSDLASGITGEIVYVDGGFNTVALGALE
jgi:enoyl-[acyl-carrier-protein] reductase (NADH)